MTIERLFWIQMALLVTQVGVALWMWSQMKINRHVRSCLEALGRATGLLGGTHEVRADE